MKQILPNWLYDLLKYLCIIAFPALEEFIPRLFNIWGWMNGDKIAETLNAVAVLIGALICVSVIQYANAKAQEEANKELNNYDTEEQG